MQRLSTNDRLSQLQRRSGAELGISQRFRMRVAASQESYRSTQRISQQLSAVYEQLSVAQSLADRMGEIAVRASDSSRTPSDRLSDRQEFYQLKKEFSFIGRRVSVGEGQPLGQSSAVVWDAGSKQLATTSPTGTTLASFGPNLSNGQQDQNGSLLHFEGTTSTISSAPNGAPVVVDNGPYNLYNDQTLNVTAALGVLANDADPNGDALTASLVAGPANGAVTFNVDGSFSYTPNPGFTGTDSFTYQVSDGSFLSNVATVSLQVDPRIAPSASAGEFIVNVTTSGGQKLTSEGHEQAVAMADDGTFAVAWFGSTDGTGDGVFTRLFAADGTPLTSEMQVNSYTSSAQETPVVAMAPDGSFVVVWRSAGQDGTQGGIYLQQYSSAGAPVGAEIQVNDVTAGNQLQPSVAIADDGSFVVTWTSGGGGGDGGGQGIFGRRFDSSGSALGGSFQVNTTTSNDQDRSSVAMQPDGAFTVVWSSGGGLDGSQQGVFLQRFDANGLALGGETQVNTHTLKDQDRADIAIADNGESVVIWQSNDQDGSNWGIYAQRFDVSGSPLGGEFLVNTTTSGAQKEPDLAMGPDGNFVVSWMTSGQDGNQDGVYARWYDGSGNALTGEELINTTTSGDQHYGGAAFDSLGNAVFVWHGKGAPDTQGVYAKLFSIADLAPVASDDLYYVDQDSVLSAAPMMGVSANDWDREADALTASLVAGPTNGGLVLNGDGSFVYTPNAGFSGTDSFTYHVNDGTQSSNTASVTIEVQAPPVGSTTTEGTIGDFVISRDGRSLIYLAQSSDPSNDVYAERTVMKLDLHDRVVTHVNLRSAGSTDAANGHTERSRLAMDDRGRIWVMGRYSSAAPHDYFVPALLDPSNMELDYGWDLSDSEWNGGSTGIPSVRVHQDWTQFSVHGDRIYYVDNDTEAIRWQSLSSVDEGAMLLDLPTFESDTLASRNLQLVAGQALHRFSADGQYVALEAESISGPSKHYLVVVNTDSGGWSSYEVGASSNALVSAGFDRDNHLIWTNAESSRLYRATIASGSEPVVEDVEVAGQLRNAQQVGVADTLLAGMGLGLRTDSGGVGSALEFGITGGDRLTDYADVPMLNSTDLGISRLDIETVKASAEAVAALQETKEKLSTLQAHVGARAARVASLMRQSSGNSNQFGMFDSAIREPDQAAEALTLAQSQILSQLNVDTLHRYLSGKEAVLRSLLGKLPV